MDFKEVKGLQVHRAETPPFWLHCIYLFRIVNILKEEGNLGSESSDSQSAVLNQNSVCKGQFGAFDIIALVHNI